MGCSKSSSNTEVYSNTILPQETRKISNNLCLYLKQLEKEEQTKPRETPNSQSNLEKKTVELEESGSLISDYSTKLQSRKLYGTVTNTDTWINETE